MLSHTEIDGEHFSKHMATTGTQRSKDIFFLSQNFIDIDLPIRRVGESAKSHPLVDHPFFVDDPPSRESPPPRKWFPHVDSSHFCVRIHTGLYGHSQPVASSVAQTWLRKTRSRAVAACSRSLSWLCCCLLLLCHGQQPRNLAAELRQALHCLLPSPRRHAHANIKASWFAGSSLYSAADKSRYRSREKGRLNKV